MKAEVALGLRLAGIARRGGWAPRWRSLSVFVAGVAGCYLLLTLAAITASEITQRPLGFVESGVKILLATVVLVVLTPVLTLAATTARLAAATRDRQLANLRLIGLSPKRTRLVAAAEGGVSALVGAVVGSCAFVLTRPMLAQLRPAGRNWPLETLVPHWYAAMAAVALVPTVVVAVAMVPRVGQSGEALAIARRGPARRPRLARLIPLVLGVGLAVFVIANAESRFDPNAHGTNDWLAPYLFAGMALLPLGTLLSVPWLVRVLADVLVGHDSRPGLRIAGRRLQAQPSGVTRIVAGLLIGLFIVAGGRAVVVAFEDTSQYRSAALMESIGQVGTIRVEREMAQEVIERLRTRPDVAVVQPVTLLEAACAEDDVACGYQAYVGTCADLAAVVPTVRGCQDGVVTRLNLFARGTEERAMPAENTRWTAQGSSGAPSIRLPAPDASLKDSSGMYSAAALDGILLVPPTLPEVADLIPQADIELLIRAEPGSPIEDVFDAVYNPTNSVASGFLGGTLPSTDYYRFVVGLKALVWAIAGLVIGLGLITFLFSAVDRALSRRSEVIALQLVGVPSKLLRRSQAVEALAPLGLGAALAIGLGFLAGTSFLAFGGILDLAPLRPTLILVAMAIAGSTLVAALVAAMASPVIRAEHIRSE